MFEKYSITAGKRALPFTSAEKTVNQS